MNKDDRIFFESRYMSDKFCFLVSLFLIIPIPLFIFLAPKISALALYFKKALYLYSFNDGLFEILQSENTSKLLILAALLALYYIIVGIGIIPIHKASRLLYIVSVICFHIICSSIIVDIILPFSLTELTENTLTRSEFENITTHMLTDKPCEINKEDLVQQTKAFFNNIPLEDLPEHRKEAYIKSMYDAIGAVFHLTNSQKEYAMQIYQNTLDNSVSDRMAEVELTYETLPYCVLDNIFSLIALPLDKSMEEILYSDILNQWLDK